MGGIAHATFFLMDFLTHSLCGAGAARLISRTSGKLPQLSIASVAGALLIDADSWLHLIEPRYYGLYHRVATHSVIGMVAISLISATLVWWLYRLAFRLSPTKAFYGKVLRFGWYVSPNLSTEERVEPVRWRWLLAASGAGVLLHWIYDVITGFGNMKPFWPWSDYDASLHAVFSFDPVIFSATLGWHIAIRSLNTVRRKEVWISLAYILLIAAYVGIRYVSGARTYI